MITLTSFTLIIYSVTNATCRSGSFQELGLRDICHLLVFGFCSGVGHSLLVTAIFRLGPGNGNLIFYTEPVFVIILSAAFLRNSFRWTDPLFAACAIASVAILSVDIFFGANKVQKDEEEEPIQQSIFGMVCGLLSAACAAVSLVVARKLSEKFDWGLLIATSAVNYFLVSLVITTFTSSWSIPESKLDVVVAILQGVSFFGGFSLECFAVTKDKPTLVATILSSDAILTYFAEFIFLGRQLPWTIVFSSLLMMLSCVGLTLTESDAENGTNSSGDRDGNLLSDETVRLKDDLEK